MNWKKEIKTQTIIILICLGIALAISSPIYFNWQRNREITKGIFNIEDESNINKTQALGLKITDTYFSGGFFGSIVIIFGIAFTSAESLRKIEDW